MNFRNLWTGKSDVMTGQQVLKVLWTSYAEPPLLLSPCFRRARSQNTSLLFRRRAGSERAVDARGALARMNNRQWGIRVGAEGGNK